MSALGPSGPLIFFKKNVIFHGGQKNKQINHVRTGKKKIVPRYTSCYYSVNP